MSTHRLLIATLFLVLFFSASSQEPDHDIPAHLLPKIEKSSPDTARIELLHQLAYYYICKQGSEKNDLDSAMTILRSALQLSQQLHKPVYINQNLKLQGDAYLEGEDLQHGGACFQQVVDYYHSTKDTSEEVNTWTRWGDCISGRHHAEKIACYTHALSLSTDSMDTRRLDLYDALGINYRSAPGDDRRNLDKAFRYFNSGERLSRRLALTEKEYHFIALKGGAYLDRGDLVHGHECIDRVIAYYHQLGNKKEESSNLVYVAVHLLDGQASEKADYLKKALALVRQLPDRDKERELYLQQILASAYVDEGKLDLAERELKQVLATAQAIGYNQLGYAYDLLGQVYERKGDHGKTLSSYLQAIDNAYIAADMSNMAHFRLMLGNTYHNLGFEDKALSYYDTILSHPPIDDISKITHATALRQKATILIHRDRAMEMLSLIQAAIKAGWGATSDGNIQLRGTEADAYMAMGQWSKADTIFSSIMPHVDSMAKYKTDTRHYLGQIYIAAGILYARMKQFRKAEFYMKKAGPDDPAIFSDVDRSSLHLLRARIDSAHGNYTSAIHEYELYVRLHDSVFNATKSRQFQELEMIYQTAQKERSIADLQNREKVQRIELSRTNAQRKYTMAGILLVLIIAILLFIGFRQKQRRNRALRVHQKEITAKNTSLEQLNYKQELLLVEKEWLMREIHHRVKNNLQTTISLLHMQSVYLSNEEAVAAIRNSQRRMQAMSLIHQRLYQSDDMASIEMLPYIAELVSYLKDSFHGAGNISFDLKVDFITLNVSQAVPLGLIINEAITNAIKYAFPGNRKGAILVSLQKGAGANYTLSIADNGIGMLVSPDTFAPHDSLGLNLIRGLTDQLQGSFCISGNNGTILNIIFKPSQLIREEALPEPALETYLI